MEAPPLTEVRSPHRWDLDVLRILAILGVVAIHVFGLILGHPELRGTATWYFGVILDKVVIFCVPMFVMISGALLLGPSAHARGPGSFISRRVRRLLPALITWHLVYLIGVRHLLLERPLDAKVVAVQFLHAEVYTGLYFLFLILGLYVVSPALAALVGGDRSRARVISVVAALWTAVVLATPPVSGLLGVAHPAHDNAFTLWLPFVGVFVAGYAWDEPRSTGLRWLWSGLVAVLMLAFITWQFSVIPDAPWLQALLPVAFPSITTVVATVALYVCVTDICARISLGPTSRRVLAALGSATFGVFLFHLVILALFQRFTPAFFLDPAPVAKVLMYLVIVTISFAVSLLAARVPGLRRVF